MSERNNVPKPAIWFPTIRAGSGADVFTERLVQGLSKRGYQAEIFWLPHRAEYIPWIIPCPRPPAWANIVHVNTRIHTRFIPANIPSVTTMHLCVHDPALRPYKSLTKKIYHRLWVRPVEAAVLRRCRAVTAVSRYTADRTRKVFGRQDIQVIHNGVDSSGPFRPSAKLIRHQPFRLLYVGNWSSRKGADLIAPIMNILGNDFELYYTSGRRTRPGSFAIPRNSHNLGLLDSDEKLAEQYQNSDALLFPSRLEGFALAVLEAQACGLPVVATTSSSIPESVDDGVTGILCTQDDCAAFATAVRKLADDPDLFARMSQSARSRVVREFSQDDMIQQYLDVYHSLICPSINRL